MTFPVEWVDKKRASVNKHRRSYVALRIALDDIQVESIGYQTVINFVTHFGLDKARLFFIGNGGSAAIASHMAIDWDRNGGFSTFGPRDAANMTCLSNDHGFEYVYSRYIGRHGMLGDVLFAISSSGMSQNIINAVDVAKSLKMNVVTLSGFKPENSLRQSGQVNFWVPSMSYGTVEIAHLAILHSILDEVISEEKKA